MILHLDGGLDVATFVLGALMTNCYVLRDREDPAGCWVVDPGLEPQPLLDYLRARDLTPQRVLLTHCHGDHIAGCGAVKHVWPQVVLTAPAGEVAFLADPVKNMSLPFGFRIAAPEADETVAAGERLRLGERIAWEVLDTSGHTPGGLSYYNPPAGVVITGDALFAGSVGRTDIPGACESRLLRNIRQQLLALPDATRVLPGHGPPSTIGQERRSNPYLR